ncbi:carbohydrate ABC transporter permease [uncultured Sphaerochaeta sp.]|jgi:multiple sugar transport system permease protein|uniref:carbohydrate ABC transporter permease n=1 Tax=uncultured Sphaerochaeta sp. TaxID=886478 RepID=UPI002AA7A565|nr:carbohydrate ABC transporter permease [uncultured Sphaerochaeta sp.]
MLTKSLVAKKRIFYVVIGIVIGVFLVFVLFPYYWMLITALKPKSDLFLSPPDLFPKRIVLSNIIEPWKLFPVFTYMKNSIYISTITILLNVFFGSMAAYGLNQPRFKTSSKYVMTFLLITQLLPGMATLVPFYFWMTQLNMLNTYIGLILPYLAWTLPFTILMLRAYFKSAYPKELEEAARIDGCSRMAIFWKIVIPLSAPGLIAAGANAFMLSWKEFIWASIMLTSGSKKPISIGMRDMIGQGGGVTYIQEFMAVAILAVVPAFVLFFFTQKYIAGGITAGAVKS